jgi:hypothetical protein
MAETKPTSEIARKVCDDIFASFGWEVHPKEDSNFSCLCEHHKNSKGTSQKKTHPADVVFCYDDPYLGRRTYLHTDMKSYAKDSITPQKMREALRSLCMTVECARLSEEWRNLYSVPDDQNFEVQGLLFVHNHDRGYQGSFEEVLGKVSISALPVAPNTVLHFMGPKDIGRLYSIAHDLMTLKYKKAIPENYTFYYPDLILKHRQGDVWNQPATIEYLMSPYLLIKHGKTENQNSGFIIYYNRAGETTDEFVYLLDCMSRFQMLEKDAHIRIRNCFTSPSENMLSNFRAAVNKYAKAWGFDSERKAILDAISFESIASMIDTYNPGNAGWRDEEEN